MQHSEDCFARNGKVIKPRRVFLEAIKESDKKKTNGTVRVLKQIAVNGINAVTAAKENSTNIRHVKIYVLNNRQWLS